MRSIYITALTGLLLVAFVGESLSMPEGNVDNPNTEVATLGGGCFWCIEAIFEELRGVVKVESGYSGGASEASYQEVCTGESGHAEVVRVTFNPDELAFNDLLEVFFAVHDPTTLNRQGADTGTQYRSAIFFHDETQQAAALEAIRQLTAQKAYSNPVVTEVAPFDTFYRAEDYHQDYYANNKTQSYCSVVISPKIEKFRRKFADKRK